jgi:hypothetical protein
MLGNILCLGIFRIVVNFFHFVPSGINLILEHGQQQRHLKQFLLRFPCFFFLKFNFLAITVCNIW